MQAKLIKFVVVEVSSTYSRTIKVNTNATKIKHFFCLKIQKCQSN